MFESRSIEQSPIDNVSSNSNEKTRRDTTHKFENLLYYDPEDEEDKPFIQVFLELASTCGIDDLLDLSYGNLRTIYSNLNRKTNSISIFNITRIRSLHFSRNIFKKKDAMKVELISTIHQLTKMTIASLRAILPISEEIE